MSYDLISVPEGYRTDLVLIVAPYIDIKFTENVIARLKPKRTRIIVDDGTRIQDLTRILECFRPRSDVQIALGAAAGLVHMKLYYFEFVRAEGQQRRKRRMIFGSANATNAGFSGAINSELIADLELSPDRDAHTMSYINLLVSAIESKDSGFVPELVSDGFRFCPTVRFPSVRIAQIGPPPGFDAWLQRGLLAAKYRDPQQFLVSIVKLKQKLPQDLVAQTFAKRGLMEHGSRDSVRFLYIRLIDLEIGDEGATPMWKAKYCNWTHLGDWMSEDCYRQHGSVMKTETHNQRSAKIELLRANGDDLKWQKERADDFLETLSGVWHDLKSPHEFLDGDKSGPDKQLYSNKFEKKLKADLLRSKDGKFCERYVNGYDFPPVPRFRQDAIAWDAFTQSWCESILVEAQKSAVFSKITKAVLAAAEMKGVALQEFTPDGVLDFLRSSWNKVAQKGTKRTVGDDVSNYFLADDDE
jgi:hypothetical protein